jgi:hypothetical protein
LKMAMGLAGVGKIADISKAYLMTS